ncbi:MAG: NAD-dependent epimerase/dehydratase family protein [Bacillus sp. (in: Bacteria)]|nr:NAD-dependent epimerase/dehydratase family protein [Bacillus sp. (in: firmicutes)]
MKVLVTGGAGFIGMHVVQRLLRKGVEMIVIDCLDSYYSEERKKQHLQVIRSVSPFRFYPTNLLNREETFRIVQQEKPDVVIHLAALPGVSYSLKEPLQYVDYDIKATINILEASGKVGVRHVIFSSSSSVYGNLGVVGPKKEEEANGHVISPYAAAKWGAESFCHVYANLYQFRLTILRLFTVYGPWGRPDMAIAKFLKQILSGEKITLFGTSQKRDFTYIDDVVNAVEAVMDYQGNETVFNIGNGQPVSMTDVVRLLQIHFPSMMVEQMEKRAGDVQQTWANIEKAQQHLMYMPKTTFQEGLEKTIEWAKANIHLL